MNYTPAQLRAIESSANTILCVAGPGSGKTATTVARIRRLIDSGVAAERIVALTFTNAAANELQARIYASAVKEPGVYPREIPRLGFCGTLHGFALRILKQHGAGIGYGARIAIAGEGMTEDMLASKARSLGCNMPLEKLLKLKSEGMDGQKRTKTRLPVEQMVLMSYYDELREAGLVDFDSILAEFRRLLNTVIVPADRSLERASVIVPPAGEFTHLFVDEVQDSAAIDWDIYDALPMANKFFVGDADQSIYAFRGGRPDLMNRPMGEIIMLEDNFRSHAEICDAANRLIAHNVRPLAKATLSVKGLGGRVTKFFPAANAGHELGQVLDVLRSDYHPDDCKEVAVLARTNAIANEFRAGLKAAGVSVVEEVRSAMPNDWTVTRALINLLVNPDNDFLAMAFIRAKGVRSREEVHEMRRACLSSGHPMNSLLGFPRDISLDAVGRELAAAGISAESRMLVAEKIRQLPAGADLLQLALLLAGADESTEPPTEGVTVTTFHGAKGREWDVVFLVGMEDEVIPGQRKTATDQDVEEERRLAYVGVTRARKHLYLSHAETRTVKYGPAYSKIEPHTPSRFLKEMLAG